MINSKDFLHLSKYCFNVCEVLDAAIRGKNTENPNGSVTTALEDSKRYFDWPWPCLLTIPIDRVLREIERVLRRGASTPRIKHERENIEGHILEINQILGAISKNGVFRARTDCSPILLSQLQTPQPVDVWSDASSPRTNSLP